MKNRVIFLSRVLLCSFLSLSICAAEKTVSSSGTMTVLEKKTAEVSMEFVQKIKIKHKLKYKDSFVGGLSGLDIHDGKIYSVSDDRGRFGPARIYEWTLQKKNNSSEWDIHISNMIPVESKKIYRGKYVLDLEALAIRKNQFLLSSEGDLNNKPRILPEILLFDNHQLVHDYIEIPDEFLANKTGVLKKGLYNNMAFEGMTLTSTTDELFLLSEGGLIQEKDKSAQSSFLLKYKFENNRWVYAKKWKINFDKYLEKVFIYFGATEIKHWKDNKFFILTRGIPLSANLEYDCSLWMIDLDNLVNTDMEMEPVMIQNFSAEKYLTAELSQNYEGLVLIKNKDENYMIIVSDDNFNRNESTEFVIFKLK